MAGLAYAYSSIKIYSVNLKLGTSMTKGIPSEFITSAEQGDPTSQYAVGWHYENGKGVRKDLAEAEKWWQKAAKGGSVSAQRALGNLAYSRKDLERAAYWWKKAAEAGNPAAQHCIGFFCSEIIGADEALKWTKQAANNGDAEAQKFLGFMTFWGHRDLIPRDRVQALKWLILGTEQSQSRILQLHYRFTKGWIKWFMSSAEIAESLRSVQQWKQSRVSK